VERGGKKCTSGIYVDSPTGILWSIYGIKKNKAFVRKLVVGPFLPFIRDGGRRRRMG
jgi:hypothetical protein